MAAPKTARTSVVLVMAGGEDEAATIARTLIDERLAACANIIGPVRSIYRWRDKVEDAREYLIMIKTRTNLYSRLERRVRDLHSYEVPEVITLTIARGAHRYLQWIADNTKSPPIVRRRVQQ